MEVPKKTARLKAVVDACGAPEPVTLWVDPRADTSFQAAVRQNRVMTIKQETVGTRKDFGVVGFHPEDNVSYWVFPQSLRQFEGKRIVGIDYSVLRLPEVKHPVTIETARPVAPPKRVSIKKHPGREPTRPPHEPEPAREQPSKPAPKPALPLPRFRVVVRAQATVDTPHEVEARNKSEAKAKALALNKQMTVEFSRASPTLRVIKIEVLS